MNYPALALAGFLASCAIDPAPPVITSPTPPPEPAPVVEQQEAIPGGYLEAPMPGKLGGPEREPEGLFGGKAPTPKSYVIYCHRHPEMC